jgi:hypothetical protein
MYKCTDLYVNSKAHINFTHTNTELVTSYIWPTDSQLKSTSRTNYYIYTVHLLMICPKYVGVDWPNKLSINSASSWFSLHRYNKEVPHSKNINTCAFTFFTLFLCFHKNPNYSPFKLNMYLNGNKVLLHKYNCVWRWSVSTIWKISF